MFFLDKRALLRSIVLFCLFVLFSKFRQRDVLKGICHLSFHVLTFAPV